MSKYLSRVYTFLVFLFLYAPIAVLIFFSFNNSRYRGQWDGFSLRWYKELLDDRIIVQAFYNTITIAILTTIVATVLGTIAAIGLSNIKGVKKKVIMNLNYMPVVSPDILIGISLMILFIFSNIRLGYVSLLLAHITFCTPYVILSVLPKITQLNKYLFEAALDLGATPWQAIRKVILPQIMPGIFTGGLLAFTLSLDDFVVSFFTTGSGINTLPIAIYSMAKRGINPKINAVSTILFVVVLVLLIIVNKRTNTEKKEEGVN
ncbi:MAG: ABC transporter permease [Eubacteriales bacterium]|nr:ABC transporter permease [Eubacteriales bacterium]NCC81619.1 ABC transporter permease [Clostridia bacterium]